MAAIREPQSAEGVQPAAATDPCIDCSAAGSTTHRILPDQQLAYVSVAGAVSLDRCLSAIRSLTGDPFFRVDFKVICDIRKMAFHPDGAEAVQIARTLVNLREQFKGKIALVVADKVQMFAARLVSSLATAGGLTMMAFYDLESASRM